LSPEDRRLCAFLAAFVPLRAVALASLIGGRSGGELRDAVESLVTAGRAARLAELARAVAPPTLVNGRTAESRHDAPEAPGLLRLRERLRLEARPSS
jgi:hypothetical protein